MRIMTFALRWIGVEVRYRKWLLKRERRREKKAFESTSVDRFIVNLA